MPHPRNWCWPGRSGKRRNKGRTRFAAVQSAPCCIIPPLSRSRLRLRRSAKSDGHSKCAPSRLFIAVRRIHSGMACAKVGAITGQLKLKVLISTFRARIDTRLARGTPLAEFRRECPSRMQMSSGKVSPSGASPRIPRSGGTVAGRRRNELRPELRLRVDLPECSAVGEDTRCPKIAIAEQHSRSTGFARNLEFQCHSGNRFPRLHGRKSRKMEFDPVQPLRSPRGQGESADPGMPIPAKDFFPGPN